MEHLYSKERKFGKECISDIDMLKRHVHAPQCSKTFHNQAPAVL